MEYLQNVLSITLKPVPPLQAHRATECCCILFEENGRNPPPLAQRTRSASYTDIRSLCPPSPKIGTSRPVKKKTFPTWNLHLRRSPRSRHRPSIQHPAARMVLINHPIPGQQRCSLRRAPRLCSRLLRLRPSSSNPLSNGTWI